ncbi:cytosine permease [Lacisediminihabitans sp. H27-G8]|uniref:cytosine permease n=1 Tax=Lacisediminihabitans sp. H27-G8 TaxID=3111909 RepID=UPI0038FC722E
MDTEAFAGAAAEPDSPVEPAGASDGFEHYDDDALAAAMSDEAVRLGLTGSITIMPPPTTPAVSTPRPPPMARAVYTGPAAPREHDEPLRVTVPGPLPVNEPAAPLTITPHPALDLSNFPAPSGEPVVFDSPIAEETGVDQSGVEETVVEQPVVEQPAAGAPPVDAALVLPPVDVLPTRRSIRDAEHARARAESAREETARRAPLAPAAPMPPGDTEPAQGPEFSQDPAPAQGSEFSQDPQPAQGPEFSPDPAPAQGSEFSPDPAPAPHPASSPDPVGLAVVNDDTIPVPEVPSAPDFPRAPAAPDPDPDFGDTSPVATVSPQSVTAAPQAVTAAPVVSAAAEPPVYELIEPQPYTAVPTVIPPGFVPNAAIQPAHSPAGLPARFAPQSADAVAGLSTQDQVGAQDPVGVQATSATELPGDDGLRAPGTMNPFLQSAAIAVIERQTVGARVFTPEASGSQPTPLDQRVGRASRLFWLWFAANSSVISLAFGAAIFSLGMSLRQAVVAAFIGVAISFLPLGLGTLAGKWSGQPVMVVSRATFGHLGNILPAAIALLSRLFWGAVLLWIIAAATARILVRSGFDGTLTELQLMVIVMAAGFLLALIVAFFGYALFARIQLVLGILSAGLIVALLVITWPAVDISAALTVGDGPVILVVTGIVLVFSFVGLVWANSSGDLARYQRPSSSGGAAMLWASFGTTVPSFLLIAYGAILAASDPAIAKGLGSSPIDTIASLLPGWYPLPLIAAISLSLLSGVILSIYSGGFALGALGLKVTRSWATVIVGILVFAVAIALGFTVSNVVTVFRDLATTLAVPVAAWAGIFSAEMILRRRRFDTKSLLARGGIYRDVNWLNLSMLVVASVIGWGLTSASLTGLGWQGYLFRAAGVRLSSALGSTDAGVLVSLALGVLTPLVAGISTIRRQERRQASRP